MNDNLLIAAVLREVATAVMAVQRWPDCGKQRNAELLAYQLRERATELDPPEKNEG